MEVKIKPSAMPQELGDLLVGEVFNHNGEAYMLVDGAGENSTAVAAVEFFSGKVLTFSRHEMDFRRVRNAKITGSEI